MWYLPIMIFTQQWIPLSFHGYIPRRGTGTAWKQVLTEVVEAKYVFELDFKQFFPSIDAQALRYQMGAVMYFPPHIAMFVYLMNVAQPLLPAPATELPMYEWTHTPESKSSLAEHVQKVLLRKGVQQSGFTLSLMIIVAICTFP